MLKLTKSYNKYLIHKNFSSFFFESGIFYKDNVQYFFLEHHLNHIHFGLKLYVEFFFYRVKNFLRELPNFCSCSTTIIHNHQRLMRMNTNIFKRFSFPSTIFNQPSSGYFNLLIYRWVSGYFWMRNFEFIVVLLCDSRVLKEATGITNLIRIR